MAAGNSFFNLDAMAPTTFAAVDVPPGLERYFAASSGVHGGYSFQKAAAGAPAGVPDVGSLVAGIGMPPASFVMPEGALAAAGYGAMGAVPVPAGVVVARQPRAGTSSDGEAVPFKGAWTKEEDVILKEMVNVYGDRKWAVIAQSLPGRIGKQCRERWTNHLRPDIKKDIWTEEDDKALIEAHMCYGNRWSAISKCLPGRSENAVKNHWNATKRSLRSKRRLKKKKSEQAAPGEFTTLEDYIRSKCPADETTEPLQQPPPVPAPPSNNLEYHTLVASAAAVQVPSSMFPSAGMGMYLNSAGLAQLNMPAMPSFNDAYGELPGEYCLPSLVTPENLQRYGVLHSPAAAPHDVLVAHASLNCTYPLVAENLAGNMEFEYRSSNRANVGGHYGEVGLSITGGDPDDIDVVQMASREFLTISESEATLDLTRFL